jgi:predicted nuclease of restriction endonuclease-like (RecB) superfamily
MPNYTVKVSYDIEIVRKNRITNKTERQIKTMTWTRVISGKDKAHAEKEGVKVFKETMKQPIKSTLTLEHSN